MPGNFIAIDGREKAIKCDEISKDRAWNYHHSLKNSIGRYRILPLIK
jgi:hypothetical protein